eukprot:GHRQ01039928.1.p2 GENE.GHRQ01039928.1~~GHRQ01039928.1.p2  ORF type:complete len:105 (+),score=37.57 GHRQ01039928.1:40-315(+)
MLDKYTCGKAPILPGAAAIPRQRPALKLLLTPSVFSSNWLLMACCWLLMGAYSSTSCLRGRQISTSAFSRRSMKGFSRLCSLLTTCSGTRP